MIRLASPDRLSLQDLLEALDVPGEPSLWDEEKLFNWNEPE